MRKLAKGQKLYAVTAGNMSRGGKKSFTAIIETVGKKYFTVVSAEDGHYSITRHKFNVENLCQVGNFSPDYELYLSQEEYQKKLELPVLREELQRSLIGIDYENLLKVKEFIKTLS